MCFLKRVEKITQSGASYFIHCFISGSAKEGNMDRASSMHGNMEKVKDHLRDEGMDGRIYNG